MERLRLRENAVDMNIVIVVEEIQRENIRFLKRETVVRK